MVEVTIDVPGDTIEGKTDDRGRLNLGAEFGDKEVEVAILDVDERETQTAD
jgi:hypothetical protein